MTPVRSSFSVSRITFSNSVERVGKKRFVQGPITSVIIIYKCSYCFQTLRQFITTLVNYTCTSFIKLKPEGEPSEVQIKLRITSKYLNVKKTVNVNTTKAIVINFFGHGLR